MVHHGSTDGIQTMTDRSFRVATSIFISACLMVVFVLPALKSVQADNLVNAMKSKLNDDTMQARYPEESVKGRELVVLVHGFFRTRKDMAFLKDFSNPAAMTFSLPRFRQLSALSRNALRNWRRNSAVFRSGTTVFTSSVTVWAGLSSVCSSRGTGLKISVVVC